MNMARFAPHAIAALIFASVAIAATDVEIMGSDGTTARKVAVDSSGNVQVESASGSSLTVGGPAADDAAASGNPVPIGCMYESSVDSVDNNDIARVNCQADGSLFVGGSIASGATDSGNPVKVGGVYNSTKPTVTNGQRVDWQIGTRGSGHVTLCGENSATCITARTVADSATTGGYGLDVQAYTALFNETSHDRARGNTNITVLASAARTTTTASSDLTNYNNTQAHIVIDVTAASATPSVVCTVQGKDAQSSQYYTILASAAITGVSTTVLRVGPALTAAANTIANDFLPRTWRVNCVHGDSDSITYSIGASVVL